jgi:hypothetical protein
VVSEALLAGVGYAVAVLGVAGMLYWRKIPVHR